MGQYTFLSDDFAIMQKVIDCIDYELEDVPVKPKGWVYTDYLAVFETVSQKFEGRVSSPTAVELTEDERKLLRRFIDVYVENYNRFSDDSIPNEEAEILREVYNILS